LTGAHHTGSSLPADEDYSFDANGNRTTSGYTTGDNNQLLSDGTFNYTYDDEGNRLTRTRISSASASDYLTEYTWDHRNRLTQVTFKNNAGTVTKRVSYDYDVFDRRIAKDVDSTGDGTFERGERYVYDGEHIALVFDHTGALLNRYTHNPQHIDQVYSDEQFDPTAPGEMPTAPGDVIWPLADNQGTPRDLAEFDDATGITAIANHRVFDSFGRLVSETNPSVQHASGYTGRELDADTGLMYYRARWYDPAVGRFLSEDPIGFDANDPNLNRYTGNSPVQRRDPLGLDWGQGRWPRDPFRRNLPDTATPVRLYNRGCVGLCGLRTGMTTANGWPHLQRGVRCFTNFDDAERLMRELEARGGRPVLIAVQTVSPLSPRPRFGYPPFQTFPPGSSEVDPRQIEISPNYNYCTLFWHNGRPSWEYLEGGAVTLPDAHVCHTGGEGLPILVGRGGERYTETFCVIPNGPGVTGSPPDRMRDWGPWGGLP
jgi:RHS repeat-associated protein